MSDKVAIKTLNGHQLADETAREAAKTNTERIGQLSEEIVEQGKAIDELKENGGDDRLDKIVSFFDLSEPAQSNNLLNLDTLVRGYFITSEG